MFIQLLLTLCLCLSRLIVVNAVSITYWVDETTCKDGKNLDEAFTEVKAMASGAKEGLDEGNDGMKLAFKTIFKVETTDQGAFDKVTGMFYVAHRNLVRGRAD